MSEQKPPAAGFLAGLRFCRVCGARVPWGTPQCVECRAHTGWQRLLAGFGILVGAGTAVAVIATIARVWLMAPPPEVLAAAAAARPRPRLVVVVSIDQFPRVFLDRFAPLFVADGFRRLLDGGSDFAACHHRHAATWTGPGHASILTGADPTRTGIIGNRWFSRADGRLVGCVSDTAAPLVGAPGEGGVSPRSLRAETVGDVLRAATGGRAKVVAVGGKDRAAVLMGGKHPNAAYWFDEATCAFVTSRYYVEALPEWARAFNEGGPCDGFMGRAWERVRPDIDYTAFSAVDDRAAEVDGYGLGRVFPHPIREWTATDGAGQVTTDERYHAVLCSPFGNDLVLRFAAAALRGEALGSDDVPDLLAIGLSSNDLIGHLFGPYSQEVLDATLRTDVALRDLMRLLDAEVGAGAWVLALTSDHGVAAIPEELQKLGLLDADVPYRFGPESAGEALEVRLREHFFPAGVAPQGFPGFVAAWSSQTHPFVYLNEAVVGVERRAELRAVAARAAEALPGVARVFSRDDLAALAASRDDLEARVFRAWDRRNGGDLFVVLEPHWLATPFPAGSTHGSPYEYDTHVPLLLYGAGVRAGRVDRAVDVTDLAPTLARLLGVQAPASNQGEVLSEALAKGR